MRQIIEHYRRSGRNPKMHAIANALSVRYIQYPQSKTRRTQNAQCARYTRPVLSTVISHAACYSNPKTEPVDRRQITWRTHGNRRNFQQRIPISNTTSESDGYELAAAPFDIGDPITVYQVRYKPAIHFCSPITTFSTKQCDAIQCQFYKAMLPKLGIQKRDVIYGPQSSVD